MNIQLKMIVPKKTILVSILVFRLSKAFNNKQHFQIQRNVMSISNRTKWALHGQESRLHFSHLCANFSLKSLILGKNTLVTCPYNCDCHHESIADFSFSGFYDDLFGDEDSFINFGEDYLSLAPVTTSVPIASDLLGPSMRSSTHREM